ncbi:hypothetical protein N9W34_03045 [Rickettsiales bacterium]|nr:hypothetical protein [Rickettsiales bacterium]
MNNILSMTEIVKIIRGKAREPGISDAKVARVSDITGANPCLLF